jgi:hypothetical protein
MATYWLPLKALCPDSRGFDSIGKREARFKPDGVMFLLCEPVAVAYDDLMKRLIGNGVNEQVLPAGIYARLGEEAGFRLEDAQCDWGFSFKGLFRK